MKKIVFVLFCLSLLIFSGCDWFQKKEVKEQQYDFFYIVSNDIGQINANILIKETGSNIKTSDSVPTKQTMPLKNYTYEVTSDNHYKKIFKPILMPKSQMVEFKLESHAKINITNKDILENATLNISVESGVLKRMSMCYRVSSGILRLKLENQPLNCMTFWSNYTKEYRNRTKEYLPYGYYMCNYTERIEKCDSIENNKCYYNMPIPKRLNYKVDKCIYYSEDLTTSKEIPLNVEKFYTFSPDRDFIDIWILDEELYNNNIYIYEDLNGLDVGMKDVQVRI